MPESEFELGQQVTASGKGIGVVTDKQYRDEIALPATVGRARIVGNTRLSWFYKVGGGMFNPLTWYRESSLNAAIL